MGQLGPIILMRNGELAADVQNTLDEPIGTHWHSLLVPGEHDGGPNLPIAPGAAWQPVMAIAQDPAPVWHHSHIHERTAKHVYFGLAGVVHVTDGPDDTRGLPFSRRAGFGGFGTFCRELASLSRGE